MKIDKGTQLISKPGKRDLVLATPYLELRAVTDQANVEASSHFAQNLPAAMRNLATLLARWLGPR